MPAHRMFEPESEGFAPGLTREGLAQSALPLPGPDTLDEAEQETLERILERMKRWFYSIPANADQEYRLTPLFQGLLQSPRVADMIASQQDFYKAAERRGSFTARDRDFAPISLAAVLAQQLGKLRLSTIAIADAVASGIAPTTLKAILDDRLDALTPEDRQMVDYVQAVVRCELTPERFAGLVERLGVKAAIEFTCFVTFKVGSMYTLEAMWGLQGRVSDPTPALDLLQAYIDGEAVPHSPERSDSWVVLPGETNDAPSP